MSLIKFDRASRQNRNKIRKNKLEQKYSKRVFEKTKTSVKEYNTLWLINWGIQEQ